MGEISAMPETATTTTTKKSNSFFLQIVEHKDGSITRPQVLNSPPTSDTSKLVLSKDIPLNPTTNTSLRLYLPNPPPEGANAAKLPVIVYYHGGGFVLFSPAFVLYHEFSERLAASLPALVLSLDYRLAPDHPLPAAYHDAHDALLFAAAARDPWIAQFADPTRLFVAGSSSGGNMAYFAACGSAAAGLSLAGAVLIQPYFGGEERTVSEAESEEDEILPLRASDMMWRMALPRGATRDHEYCNPVRGGGGGIGTMMPRTQVLGCRGDPLFDRQREFVGMLEKGGVRVDARLEEDGYHAIELFDPARAEALCAQIREFVYAA